MCFASGNELPFHFIRATLIKRTDTDIIHTQFEMYIVFDETVYNFLQGESEKQNAFTVPETGFFSKRCQDFCASGRNLPHLSRCRHGARVGHRLAVAQACATSLRRPIPHVRLFGVLRRTPLTVGASGRNRTFDLCLIRTAFYH